MLIRLVAVFVRRRFADHETVGEVVKENSAGCLRRDDHCVIIRRLHLGHIRKVRRLHALLVGLDPVDRMDHVLRREWAAVMKANSLSYAKHPFVALEFP